MFKYTLAAGAAALGLAFAVPANAAVVELGLAIDDSGSISGANFLLQKNAYIAALSDPTVLARNGTVAIGVVKFSSTVVTVFQMQEITSANINSLIAALNGMTQAGNTTNIAGAVTSLTSMITGNNISSTRQVIDVSTDGVPDSQFLLDAAKTSALAAGIDQINCLGIGTGANCAAVQAGTDSFSINATFANFETALRRKIITETGGAVPEPATWGMMILGFGVIGFAMRRRRTVRFQLV